MSSTPPSRPAPTTVAKQVSKKIVLACVLVLAGVALVVTAVGVLAGWPWAMLTCGVAIAGYGWVLLTDEVGGR